VFVLTLGGQPGINPAALVVGAVVLPIADGILFKLGVPQD
jgi:hypothetical protein